MRDKEFKTIVIVWLAILTLIWAVIFVGWRGVCYRIVKAGVTEEIRSLR